jgi:hypothetical protein
VYRCSDVLAGIRTWGWLWDDTLLRQHVTAGAEDLSMADQYPRPRRQPAHRELRYTSPVLAKVVQPRCHVSSDWDQPSTVRHLAAVFVDEIAAEITTDRNGCDLTVRQHCIVAEVGRVVNQPRRLYLCIPKQEHKP